MIEIHPGDSIALLTAEGVATSYRALAQEVSAAASRLRARGAGPGRAVAVGLSDPDRLIVAALAVWECGAVLLPLDQRAGLAVTQPLISRARPALLWTQEGLQELPEAREFDARVALLLFTSGSSGAPKGVLLSRAGLRANINAILDYLPIGAHPRTALVLPLTYSYALVGQALTTLQAGGTLLLLGGLSYPEEQLAAMVRLQASGLSSVPASLRLLARAVAEGAGAPALGYLASAGAPLDARTVAAIKSAFPRAQLWNQYGLTEASPRVAALSSDDEAFARGAAGRPLRGIEVWAATDGEERLPAGESGEIVLRGSSIMLGYLDDPEATARAIDASGALHTSDLGFVDSNGCLFITGRNGGVVKCAGERVGLDEVAAALRACHGVIEACVVALPDEALGARLIGFVESATELRTIRAELRALLPPAKRPARLYAMDQLPRLPSGKIDRKALERRAGSKEIE
jgi:long-chain acyl-CoA synthetase